MLLQYKDTNLEKLIAFFMYTFQLSVQRDLLRFAQVFSQMIHVCVPLRIQNVSTKNSPPPHFPPYRNQGSEIMQFYLNGHPFFATSLHCNVAGSGGAGRLHT